MSGAGDDAGLSSAPRPGDCSDVGRTLLALTLVPGLGPVRIAQLVRELGSPQAVINATASRIGQVRGIGSGTAASIARHLHNSIERVDEELERIADAGAHVLAIGDPGYPPMLAATPSPPPILMVRGRFDHEKHNRYTCAIVGSRSCSIYGTEQGARFAGALASAGITVVSGGARGIDTAAHRGALNAGGRTTVVLGCGIGQVYPPENADLFNEIAARGGAVISELPVGTRPDAKNFPARNRIISGLSLGVLVIEAGLKSGALITARHATEEHGREVMGLPGRVDSPASAGTLELLKHGAHLVTEPGDVISILEGDAYHLYSGTHAAKTGNPALPPTNGSPPAAGASEPIGEIDDETRAVLGALSEPRTGDELAELLGVEPGQLRARLTMLEIQGRIRREGSRFARAR